MKHPRNPGPRKRRTREHVIADLGVNHVEKHVLLCGFVLHRIVQDYGLDLNMFTFSANGELENGEVWIQVKATEQTKRLADKAAIAWRLQQADLRHWLHQAMPVILIVYDVAADRAYWLHVQEYFEGPRRFGLTATGKSVTVHIPDDQVLDELAVRKFADFRNLAFRRLWRGPQANG